MDKYQKANMEDEITKLWRLVDHYRAKRDEANDSGNNEQARICEAKASKTIAKIDGIKCALCVLGYQVIWKDEKQTIVSLS